jgi:L-cystine transport system permease protein
MVFDINFAIQTFKTVLGGIPTTMLVVLVTLLFAFPLGFLLALTRINHIRGMEKFAEVYVSFVRGTPMVVQIFLMYNTLPLLLAVLLEKMGLDKRIIFDFNPIFYAFVVFILSFTASFSEVFRGAIYAVNYGQVEAALAVGMTTAQAYRRILLPQALLVALPNISNSTLTLIKSSSLVFIMTVQDIMARAKVAASIGYQYLEAYVDVLIIYVVICLAVENLFHLMEKKLRVFKGLEEVK